MKSKKESGVGSLCVMYVCTSSYVRVHSSLVAAVLKDNCGIISTALVERLTLFFNDCIHLVSVDWSCAAFFFNRFTDGGLPGLSKITGVP